MSLSFYDTLLTQDLSHRRRVPNTADRSKTLENHTRPFETARNHLKPFKTISKSLEGNRIERKLSGLIEVVDMELF